MENNQKWIDKLEEYNLLDIILKEKDDKDYSFGNVKECLNKIISIYGENLILIDIDTFDNFIEYNNNLNLGNLDKLLNKIPNLEGIEKLQEDYNIRTTRYDGKFYYHTYKGISSYLTITYPNNIGKKLERKSVNISYSKLFVLGENLTFNSILDLKKNQNKNSNAIIFSFLECLNIYIFFKGSYWETIREPQNLSFNKFIESDKCITDPILQITEIPEKVAVITPIIEYKKNKTFFSF
jgi:hypothetical protein